MRLDILSKLVLTMSIVVQLLSHDDGSGTQSVSKAVLRRHPVQPENARFCHLDDQSCRYLVEWQGVIDCPHMLFDRSDVSFDVPHVFILGCFIGSNTHACQLTLQVPEFSIQRAISILNPFCWYNCRMAFTPFRAIAVLLFGIALIVPNLIFLEMDTSIGIQFTYIISMHIVTFQYRFRTSAGTGVMGESILGGFLCVVLPLRDPMSGPNICSAASTSPGVTGQFISPLFLRAATKVEVLGLPIVICSSLALSARQ